MRCKICYENFNRGTSTKPNDYCDNCLDKYITTTVIKQTTKEIVEHYTGLINSCQEEIKKCKQTILENEELIKFSKEQMDISR